MGLKKPGACSSWLLVLFIFISSSVSSANQLSDSIVEDEISDGRNLLQAKKGCHVNFESMKYAMIPPIYPPDVCCGALTQFASPYVEDLKDLSDECATIKFRYTKLYGRFPAGLFKHECRETKLGLACPESLYSKSYDTGSSLVMQNPRPFLVLTTSLLVFYSVFF